MSHLSHRDLSLLMRVLPELYAAKPLASFPELVLSLVARLIAADRVAYSTLDFQSGGMTTISRPHDPDLPKYLPAYMAYSHELPGYERYSQSGEVPATRNSDAISQREFERLTIFNEFHRPLGIRYQLGCSLPGLHSPMVGLALARWTREFSGRDRDILEHLRPHIAAAYRNAEALGELEQKSHALTQIGRAHV